MPPTSSDTERFWEGLDTRLPERLFRREVAHRAQEVIGSEDFSVLAEWVRQGEGYIFARAKVLHICGCIDEARQLYEAVPQGSEDYSPALGNLAFLQLGEVIERSQEGRTQIDEGKLDQVEGLLLQSLAADQTNVASRNNLAAVCILRGDHETAITHYQAALEIEPAYFDVRLNLADILFKTEKIFPAKEQLDQALDAMGKVDVQMKEKELLLAFRIYHAVAFEAGDQAIKYGEELLRRDERYYATIGCDLAKIHDTRGDKPSAFRIMQKVNQHSPSDTQALEYLQQLRREIGGESEL